MFRSRAISLCVLLLAVLLSGCVSKSKADARARAAFIAGQQQAVVRMQQVQGQGPSITVNGEVRTRVIPWAEGMTLAKAVVAADYYGATDPAQIIIVHNGIGTRLEPQQLLSGVDVPLQPGDIVQLIPQAAPPTQ